MLETFRNDVTLGYDYDWTNLLDTVFNWKRAFSSDPFLSPFQMVQYLDDWPRSSKKGYNIPCQYENWLHNAATYLYSKFEYGNLIYLIYIFIAYLNQKILIILLIFLGENLNSLLNVYSQQSSWRMYTALASLVLERNKKSNPS